jgi:PBSX family phage terminase large subunit
MSISFVFWAFANFGNHNFAICGKSIESIKRNVISWLMPFLESQGFTVDPHISQHYYALSCANKTNRFYIFGGKDERSQDFIQGMTLAGVLFDEVALMPQSFVNQATGRTLSVKGAKWWFNCNPEGPEHPFKKNWLDLAEDIRLYHIHFTMSDNPILDDETIQRAERTYRGVFYKRFILGEWAAADGLIYDNFSDEHQYSHPIMAGDHLWDRRMHYIGIDYVTANPTAFLHVIDYGEVFWINSEFYYHANPTEGIPQRSDSQLADDFDRFNEGKPIFQTILDPSASSFATELSLRGYYVRKAYTGPDNIDFDKKLVQNPRIVTNGIRVISSLLSQGRLKVCTETCPNLVREFKSYTWDTKAVQSTGTERPIKQNDHALDALRYCLLTIIKDNPYRLGYELHIDD